MIVAIRRASSRVSNLAAARRPGSSSKQMARSSSPAFFVALTVLDAYDLRNSSGSLAIFTAILRASYLPSNLAAELRDAECGQWAVA